MTPERLAEYRRLCDAATPGPWESREEPFACRGEKVYSVWPVDGEDVETATGAYEYDAAFIAASRTAVPELLDEVERLEALAADGEKYRRLCEIMRSGHGCSLTSERRGGGCFRFYATIWENPPSIGKDIDPLAALEAAVKKAEEIENDA